MPRVLKPSGERATGSTRDRFWTARTQLTFTYTAILAVILCISSGILYGAFSNRLARRFERNPQRPPIILPEGIAPPRAEDVLRDLLYSLIFVNGLLLVLASVLSYWLAGITLDPIRETYERQRRFLSDASHELRTPLAILQADLENGLHAESLSAEEEARIESHLEEVARMGQIVKDLLLLSRLDETHLPEEPTRSIELITFLKELTGRFKHFAKQYHVTISTESSVKTLTLLTKQELLTQAVSNLLKNAIVYNKPEGNVHITLKKEGSHALIEITDTGIGMSPEHVDKVFDRFYRVDKSRSRQTGGSGLGLSITQASIDQLNGQIQVNSELNVGTTVTLTLPLSAASSFLHE